MKLTVLNSNSKGNCYLLHNKTECLILECGLSLKTVKKALGFDMSIINGAVVSHQHQDHAKYITEYAKSGIHVFANAETIAKVGDENKNFFHCMLQKTNYKIGGFVVYPLPVHHDVPCLSFIIKHEEIGNLYFAIDTTHVDYKIKNLNHIMVECNYDWKILDHNVQHGYIHGAQATRIEKSHFELENTKEFLRATPKDKLQDVVLLHLSDGNSNEERFKKECQEASGVETYIATKGLEIEYKN